MKIPFACAFIKLLASYNNTNYASYLLTFFPARYKACRGMWKFSQLSAKNFPEKITQNKVCICQKLCMYRNEFFSPWVLYLGIKMSYDTIILNCLIVPIGKLMNIPGIKVIQSIMVRKHKGSSKLEAKIQSRLGTPFNKIPLKFCIIQAGSVIERE